jgi:hypothetical protein
MTTNAGDIRDQQSLVETQTLVDTQLQEQASLLSVAKSEYGTAYSTAFTSGGTELRAVLSAIDAYIARLQAIYDAVVACKSAYNTLATVASSQFTPVVDAYVVTNTGNSPVILVGSTYPLLAPYLTALVTNVIGKSLTNGANLAEQLRLLIKIELDYAKDGRGKILTLISDYQAKIATNAAI